MFNNVYIVSLKVGLFCIVSFLTQKIAEKLLKIQIITNNILQIQCLKENFKFIFLITSTLY